MSTFAWLPLESPHEASGVRFPLSPSLLVLEPGEPLVRHLKGVLVRLLLQKWSSLSQTHCSRLDDAILVSAVAVSQVPGEGGVFRLRKVLNLFVWKHRHPLLPDFLENLVRLGDREMALPSQPGSPGQQRRKLSLSSASSMAVVAIVPPPPSPGWERTTDGRRRRGHEV